MKLIHGIIISFALLGCSEGVPPSDSGPPIMRKGISVKNSEIDKIVNTSREFARNNNLKINVAHEVNGFTVYMTDKSFSMAAHNQVDPTTAYLTAWDQGKRAPDNIKLANRYLVTIEQTVGRKARNLDH